MNYLLKISIGALGMGLLFSGGGAQAQSEREQSLVDISPEAQEKGQLPPGVEDLPPPSAGALLAERSRALDAREAEIRQAKKDLELAEEKLEERIRHLERLIKQRAQVADEIRQARKADRDERLARTVEVTGKMPPERAALLLAELPVGVSAKILSAVKSRKAAAIMAALPPSKAAEISRKYLKSGQPSGHSSSQRGSEGGGAVDADDGSAQAQP